MDECIKCGRHVDVRNDPGEYAKQGFLCGNCLSSNTDEELSEDYGIELDES